MNIIITIISTIILAVTVLTLILGILAYIVYKIRKRGSKKIMATGDTLSVLSETERYTLEQKPEVRSPTIPPAETKPVEPPSLIRRYEPEKTKEPDAGEQAKWK